MITKVAISEREPGSGIHHGLVTITLTVAESRPGLADGKTHFFHAITSIRDHLSISSAAKELAMELPMRIAGEEQKKVIKEQQS